MACASRKWWKIVPALVNQRVALARRYSNGGQSFSSDVEYTTKLGEALIPSGNYKPCPVYRVMDETGEMLPGKELSVDDDTLIKMYRTMTILSVMDPILYNSQRQGRISFYMTNYGEEGVTVASAAALRPTDTIYGQYRETGALLWRGFTLSQCMNQCYGNRLDKGGGKQMPVHYGDNDLNFQTISSPLATQMPQAPGYAYALKIQNRDDCVMCYFGDGAAQEGDAHAALNFAATLGCPTIFLCRNNKFAISTPISEQYAGDGIVSRGPGYGIESIRVDGNDVLAVFEVTSHARRVCVEEKRPVLIEAMTYRVGDHSTSDDSSRYRSKEEIEWWKKNNNPISRLRQLLLKKNLWSEAEEKQLRDETSKEVRRTFSEAEKVPGPKPELMFEDVYDEMPQHLLKQKQQMLSHINKYPSSYPIDKFER